MGHLVPSLINLLINNGTNILFFFISKNIEDLFYHLINSLTANDKNKDLIKMNYALFESN